jgi:DNA-binding transcriptional MerR regulator
MASRFFTRGELADAAGIGVDDVRFYQDRGLLQAPRRRQGRSNDFAFYPEHADRLHFIRRALWYGFTYVDIAELVAGEGLLTRGDVSAFASRRLKAIPLTSQNWFA